MTNEKRLEVNKNISLVKKKKFIESGTSILHLPETWKIECSGCKNKITFEKYHQFQNAKSAIKKGKKKFCTDCKNKNCKRSQTNRESWKIECQDEDCQTVIQYDNFPAYARALKRIEEGTPKYCDSCRETKYPKKNGPDKIYSINPDDWKVKCKWEDCDKIITYNTYGSWSGVCKRIKDGNPPMCWSCAAKHWERSEEYLEKLRGRTHSEESKDKMRQRFLDMTPEEYQKYCQRQSEISTETWKNLSEEDKSIRIERLLKNNDISIEEKERRRKILSDKAYERIKEFGSRLGFQPAFNVNTIDFIENVLNGRFSTKFIHAQTNGEFKLFDEKLKVHYFADAYCPKLNLWIEFDEKHKFSENKLMDDHIKRHNRIKEILNCEIIRFRVFKNKLDNSFNFVEFKI